MQNNRLENTSSSSKEETTNSLTVTRNDSNQSPKHIFNKWKETVFMTGVAGMSILFGFGATISAAKKKDPVFFDKGITPTLRMESGGSLALRALGWGSFYAVTGCGILFFSVWKMMGVKDLQEFREKAGKMLPRIPKNDPPQGRTEFKNLTDLLQYIIDEDEKSKIKKGSPTIDASNRSLTDNDKS